MQIQMTDQNLLNNPNSLLEELTVFEVTKKKLVSLFWYTYLILIF